MKPDDFFGTHGRYGRRSGSEQGDMGDRPGWREGREVEDGHDHDNDRYGGPGGHGRGDDRHGGHGRGGARHGGPGRGGERHGGPRHDGPRHDGPQTFRRGRALDFLQRLDVKRDTLMKQMKQPELQGIQQVLSGELKAIEMVRSEFMDVFDLHEISEADMDDAEEGVNEAESEPFDNVLGDAPDENGKTSHRNEDDNLK